jgi:hypothetical protein
MGSNLSLLIKSGYFMILLVDAYAGGRVGEEDRIVSQTSPMHQAIFGSTGAHAQAGCRQGKFMMRDNLEAHRSSSFDQHLPTTEPYLTLPCL